VNLRDANRVHFEQIGCLITFGKREPNMPVEEASP
jgi:hypothetical protein